MKWDREIAKKSAVHLVCLVLLAAWYACFRAVPPRPVIGGDAVGYLTMAYHLVHSGVLSVSPEEVSPPLPTAHREPGYPVFAALSLAVARDSKDLTLSQFLKRPQHGVAKAQTGLQILAALMCAVMVWKRTRSAPPCYLTYGLVAFNAALRRNVYQLWAEPTALFLLTALSLALLYAAETRKARYFVLAGILAAALVLTRAVFNYMWPLLVALFAWLWVTAAADRPRLLRGLVAFTAAYVLLVGGWMARNYHHFGRWYIADRGGHVLNVRAEYNTMSWAEIKGSFLQWSECRWIHSLKDRPGRQRIGNLNRYYRKACARRGELEQQYGDRTAADKVLLAEAKARILSHPFRHLLVTIPMVHRGLYIQPCPFGFLMFGSGIVLMVIGLRRKDVGLVAMLLPGFYLYAFNSFLTHNLVRYNLPLVPILWVATVVPLHRLWGWFRQPRARAKL